MEPIESSETSAYNNTLTPWTYPKEKKLTGCYLNGVHSNTVNKVVQLLLSRSDFKWQNVKCCDKQVVSGRPALGTV